MSDYTDGKYRVSTGEDGTRYLHLFNPNGDWVTMALDTSADVEPGESGFAMVLHVNNHATVVDWSDGAFESALRVLEDQATQRQGKEQEGR